MVRFPPPDFEANYSASGFPFDLIPGSGELRFSADDLAHALFVTGRAPGDRTQHGMASVWEWLHRTSLIPAYIRRSYHRRLVRSRLASELDRSELVGLSYALGQAITAVFCRRQLSVAYLMHVDRYASHFGISFGGTRKRADLFGPTINGWVVAEAKGRSRTMESTLRMKLNAQKRSILTIGGAPPWLALGCVASFPTSNSWMPDRGMRVDAFDPVDNAEDAIALPIGQDDYMLAYYRPFLTAIDVGQADEEGGPIISANFGAFGLTVGVVRTVYDRVRLAEDGAMEGLYQDVQALVDDAVGWEPGLFADGTAVETNWDQSLGTQDWEA